MKQINLIEKAIEIAVKAHENQTRKADGSPYIVHPLMVAFKLQKYNFPKEVIAAALTHDVLEDTDYPEEKLREELGDEVLEIVKAVTNDDSLVWEEKKKQYIESVRRGPEGAKAVCIADKIHNLESLLTAYKEQGPDIWKKFNRGKDKKVWFETEVLKMLKETWQHPLIEEYEGLLETLKGNSLERMEIAQAMADNLNYNLLKEAVENGEQLTDKQLGIYKELKTKVQ